MSRRTNPAKLLVALNGQLCALVLCLTGKVEGTVALPVISGISLYILGNGVTMLRGQQSSPALGHQPKVVNVAEREPVVLITNPKPPS